jgi:hypothetical protein
MYVVNTQASKQAGKQKFTDGKIQGQPIIKASSSRLDYNLV